MPSVWASSGNTTIITTNGTVWNNWNNLYSSGATTSTTVFTNSALNSWGHWNYVYEETAEQRRTRECDQAAARERIQEQRREQARVRDLATARSVELLMSLLTEDQAASYREHGWFEVRGSRGRRWRIRNRGQQGNVDLMPEIGDERVASFCCHPPGMLPDADAHTAQMLHIVTDEDSFIRTANVTHGREALRALQAVA